MTPTNSKKVNGKESNGKWWTPAVLLGIMTIVGGIGLHLINRVDAASLERTKAVKEGLRREIDEQNKRLERIEGKIDRLILDKK